MYPFDLQVYSLKILSCVYKVDKHKGNVVSVKCWNKQMQNKYNVMLPVMVKNVYTIIAVQHWNY